MSRELPEGWRHHKLGELTQITGGTTPSKEIPEFWEGGSLFWATPTDITALPAGRIRLSATKAMVTNSALEKTSLKMLPVGSVLMTSRATIGYPAINTVPMATNQGFANFHPSSTFDPTFLAYWIIFSRATLENSAGGSTFPEISKASLKSIPIFLPPLHEQRQIAEILSSADEAIAATRAVIEQTRKVKQGVLERLLIKGIGHTRFKQTEIGEIPEGWEIKSVDELCVLSNGNGFRPPDWSDTGLPIIRIQNLNGSKNFNYFNRAPLDKWLINPGDLLFAWAGVRGVSFGPTIWPGPLGVLNQHIFKISCRENVDKLWLFQTLKLITFKIEAKAHGFKDSLLHVHKKEITGQPVAVPPFAEQLEISTKAAELQAAEDLNQSSLDRLLSLKSDLMSDLFTGRKRVTDVLPMAAE